MGYSDCNGDPKDGCEVDTASDADNCGACFTSCALPHAKVSCKGGACKFDGCETGFSDCNGDPKDGCEINTTSDPENCGSCGTVCPAPAGKSAVCNNGQCGVSDCAAPLADCDHDPTGSCETNLSSSPGNCGFCGNVCGYAHATASCKSGSCALGPCDAGYADCDDNSATGCETNTGASIQDCGSCGHVCTGGANATASCNNGTCGLACSPGYANCNSNLQDGCETALNTVQNCGSCGNSIGAAGMVKSISGGDLCGASASGNKLTFMAYDLGGSCSAAGSITLSGATATGSVTGGSSLCAVSASGNKLTFMAYDFNATCDAAVGTLTLTGATTAGSAKAGNSAPLCGVSASGNKLTFMAEDNNATCSALGTITLGCSP